MAIFNGATAKALQATLDDIANERTDGDDCIVLNTSWMQAAAANTALQQAYAVADTRIALGDVRGPVYRDGVATTAPLELNDGRVFTYDGATLRWVMQAGPAMAKAKPVCTCGGKFAGGTHSHWCDINE